MRPTAYLPLAHFQTRWKSTHNLFGFELTNCPSTDTKSSSLVERITSRTHTNTHTAMHPAHVSQQHAVAPGVLSGCGAPPRAAPSLTVCLSPEAALTCLAPPESGRGSRQPARSGAAPVIDPVYMSRKIRKFRTDKFDT